MEDEKPLLTPLTTQHCYLRDTKDEMSSLPQIQELPMKTGEVFRNSEGQYTFVCFDCGRILEDFGEIISHCDNHYLEEKYDVVAQAPEYALCPETGSELPDNLSSLKQEISSTSISEPSKASIAPTSTTVTSDVSVQKRKRRKRVKNAPLPNFPQSCPICDVWCDDFRDHMKNVHDFRFRILQCYICKRFFKNSTTLKRHISSKYHSTSSCYQCAMEPPVKHPSESRRHNCLFCKEWFRNHVEFKIHFHDAHGKNADYFFRKKSNCNVFTCYICEREVPFRDYLVEHMRIHSDKFLRHQCPTCGKRRRTYGQLTQHMKVHEGKTFPCDQCDKVFPYYARLRLHRFTHLTELKFECDQCSKKFKQKKYLQQHKAIHKNDRKYACKFCDATFNFTSGRRAHEKSQHNAL